jgi:hypothetical protein
MAYNFAIIAGDMAELLLFMGCSSAMPARVHACERA